MTRDKLFVAVAIFVVVLASRLPFVTTYLWAWDSALYARALEEGFHVSADPVTQRPHPPGYIWYVAAAQAARIALGDSNAALVLVAMVASAAGAALLFVVASRYVRRAVALALALAYAASPLVWTYSEVAYPYTVLGLLSLALGWILLERWRPILASLALGVLAGFRQDLLILLAPLWVWSVAPLGPRRAAVAAGTLAAGALTWFVPSAALSGGPGAYLGSLAAQTASVTGTYSAPVHGLPALAYNLAFTAESLAWGLGALALMLVVEGLARIAALARRRAVRPGRPEGVVPRGGSRVPQGGSGVPGGGSPGLATGLALWTLPALAFFAVVHIGEWGHALSVIPPLSLVAAILVDRAVSRWSTRAWALAGTAAVILPAAVFVAGDLRFSAARLARHDAQLAARTSYVRAELPPRSTLILAREDATIVRYYLPEYRIYYYDPDPHARIAARPKRLMRTTTVVVFTEGLRPSVRGDVRRIEIAPGIELFALTLEGGSVLELAGERYLLREAPGR